MSRKDYESLARAIREQHEREPYLESRQAIMRTALLIANVLAADNPRFDRERFLEACGLGVLVNAS
jgi:hypothetical protein